MTSRPPRCSSLAPAALVTVDDDERLMREALEEARRGLAAGEVPVECGRYSVERALAFDLNPNGHCVYLAWFKHGTNVADCISPERRHSFEHAARDCVEHINQQRRAA